MRGDWLQSFENIQQSQPQLALQKHLLYIVLYIQAGCFNALWIKVLIKALPTTLESDCLDLPAFCRLQGHDWSIHRPARTRCSPHWILSWGIPAERRTVTIVWNVISSNSELCLSLLCGCSCSCWYCCRNRETNDRLWCCEGGVHACVCVCLCGHGRRVGWALLWLVLREGEEPCVSGPQEPLRCCGQHF